MALALLSLSSPGASFAQTRHNIEPTEAGAGATSDDSTKLTDQADALSRQGRYAEAEVFYQKALALRRATLGENNLGTATSYNNLAANLNAQGRYAEAEPLYRKALSVVRLALGDGHPDAAAIYNNIAVNLGAQGRYVEADPIYRKALAIRRAALGENNPDTAASYDNLAVNLNAQGHYAEAEPLFRKALEVRRVTLGENHPDTATSYHNVAINLYWRGHYTAADPLFRKALAIRREALGENHPDTARAYDNLAGNLRAQGRYAEADPLLRKALAIRRATLGENHPDTATSYNDTAGNLKAQGLYAEADPLYRKALAIRRAGLGENHPDTAASYNNIASDLNAEGRYAEADPLYRKALDIRRAVLGENHPYTAEAYNNLAFNLNALGRYAEADPLFRKALDVRRATLGENHPDTATGYNNLAANLNAQGHYADADLLYRKALDIYRATEGENHPDTAQGYNNLASNLVFLRRYGDADPLFRKALAIRRATLGETHPDTGTSYNNLAFNLNALGRFAEADPLYRKALAIRRTTLGEMHPDTAETYSNIAANLDAKGSYAEAEHSAADALTIAIFLRNRDVTNQHNPASAKDPLANISSTYLRAAWKADAPGLRSASPHATTALQAAQDLVQSASSRAMIRAAARQAASSGPLAGIVREEQDMSARAGIVDRRIIGALGSKNPADADKLRAQRDTIAARLTVLDAEIDRDFPTYRAIVSPQPLPLDRIQGALMPDEGLLLLLIDGDDIYSFAVGKRALAWNRIAGGAPGTLAKIAHLRCQVDTNACKGPRTADEQRNYGASHSQHFDLRAANDLYTSLVAPIEKALGGVHRLYLTTSGALGDLPIGMLVTTPPVADAADPDAEFHPEILARAPWFADRYAITYLPAVSGLLLRNAQKPANHATTVPFDGYGDPHLLGSGTDGERGLTAFSGMERNGLPVGDLELIRKLQPLPGTAVELRGMATTLDAPSSMVHVLDQATESALKSDPLLSRARVVAFVTHGALAGEGARAGLGFSEPGLIFTPPQAPISLPDGSTDDGVLTASEASLLSLSADWVILSACNTASAEGSSGGDGLSALSRGFLYAGAHALLASHWRVADDSASALTDEAIDIHQHHPELTKAQALQHAMRTIRTGVRDDGTPLANYFPSFAHPADWAPFTEIADHDE